MLTEVLCGEPHLQHALVARKNSSRREPSRSRQAGEARTYIINVGTAVEAPVCRASRLLKGIPGRWLAILDDVQNRCLEKTSKTVDMAGRM